MTNTYNVTLNCGVYGEVLGGGKANTPYDAYDKAVSKLPWRWKEELTTGEVMILDGTKQTWIFEEGNE